MPSTLAFPQMAVAPAALLAGPVHLQRTQGAPSLRGGGVYGHPPSMMRAGGGCDDVLAEQPPIGEVVGAGAVGVLAGESCTGARYHTQVFVVHRSFVVLLGRFLFDALLFVHGRPMP